MKQIPLTKGYVALVSDKDYKRVSQFKWCATECFSTNGKLWNVYAVRSTSTHKGKKHKSHLMHRFILGVEGSHITVDHFPDSSGLNNQRSNLRLATEHDNHRNTKLSSSNTSGYKGIWWRKECSRWEANIKLPKKKFLGYFTNPKEAARAYDKAAIKYFGKFARTNESLGLL